MPRLGPNGFLKTLGLSTSVRLPPPPKLHQLLGRGTNLSSSALPNPCLEERDGGGEYGADDASGTERATFSLPRDGEQFAFRVAVTLEAARPANIFAVQAFDIHWDIRTPDPTGLERAPGPVAMSRPGAATSGAPCGPAAAGVPTASRRAVRLCGGTRLRTLPGGRWRGYTLILQRLAAHWTCFPTGAAAAMR
ncbi:unnamed protein product [Parascedosporium putredinis]|uniref:Uncharacterized protein n=1 Tax=Parascedosporium putredinis TaxID=1442378 RepID=A0A9P1MF28_9PEZI|nr:unnamed protein product [Parascedosporium putredinis]CAI8001561.1 unnamed protein product [Parascedosporium putredinis]